MEKVAQKNEQKVTEKVTAVSAAPTTGAKVKTPEQLAAFKAAKKEAARKFAERQAAAKKERQEVAAEFLKFIAEKKVQVPQQYIDLLNGLANPVSHNGGNGNTFFNKVFGDSPKAGDKVTLIDYMKKTLRAKKDIDKAIENWKKSGIEVKFNPAPNMLESTYEIVKC